MHREQSEPPASVDLGVWRTPLEPAPRLAQAIGLRGEDLWLKRISSVAPRRCSA